MVNVNRWEYKNNNIHIIRDGDDYMYVIKDKIVRIKNNKVEIESKNMKKNKQMNIFDFIGG